MSTTQVALTVHLLPEGATDQFISQLQRELLDTGIGHSTFQIENKDMSNDFWILVPVKYFLIVSLRLAGCDTRPRHSVHFGAGRRWPVKDPVPGYSS